MMQELLNKQQGIFSYGKTIARLALPECLTIALGMTYLIDLRMIAQTQPIGVYMASSLLYTFFNLMQKMAEAIALSSLVMIAPDVSRKQDASISKKFGANLLLGVMTGLIIMVLCLLNVTRIINFYLLPVEIAAAAYWYVVIRSIALGIVWINAPLMGCIRAYGMTDVLMYASVVASALGVAVDGAFLWGVVGYWAWYGSAIAAVIQQVLFMGLLVGIIVRKNLIPRWQELWHGISIALTPLLLTVPVMLDKSVLAFAKIWIARCMGSVGSLAQSTFCIVKDLEQIAFLPALAIASATAIVISRLLGSHKNIPAQDYYRTFNRVVFAAIMLAFASSGIILCSFCIVPHAGMGMFGRGGLESVYAVNALIIISLFAFFDVVQLILAASLRAIKQVWFVLLVRFGVTIGITMPASWIAASWGNPFALTTFIAIFGSFYLSGIIMSCIYILSLYYRGDRCLYEKI